MKHLEIMMKGPGCYMNVKKNISAIKEHDEIENNPMLKLSSKLAEINKSFLYRKR
jgi:hypothetical protein